MRIGIKRSVAKAICKRWGIPLVLKSVKTRRQRFLEIKAELLKHCKQKLAEAQAEEAALRKAIIGWERLEKAAGKKPREKAENGAIRTWSNGKKYRRVAPGKWVRVYQGNEEAESKGGVRAWKNIIKKLNAIDDERELMWFVQQNRMRFIDNRGYPLNVVEQLSELAEVRNVNIIAKKSPEKIKELEDEAIEREGYEKQIADMKAKVNSFLSEEHTLEELRGLQSEAQALQKDINAMSESLNHRGNRLARLERKAGALVNIVEGAIVDAEDAEHEWQEAAAKQSEREDAGEATGEGELPGEGGGDGDEPPDEGNTAAAEGNDRSKRKIAPKKEDKVGKVPNNAKELANALEDVRGKEIVNAATGIKAILSLTGINKIASNEAVKKSDKNGFSRREHFSVATQIKNLFEKANLVYEGADRKGDPNIKSIKRFVAETETCDDKKADVLLTVKESVEHGHRIYSLELDGINKASQKGWQTENSVTDTPEHIPTTGRQEGSIPQPPKNASEKTGGQEIFAAYTNALSEWQEAAAKQSEREDAGEATGEGELPGEGGGDGDEPPDEGNGAAEGDEDKPRKSKRKNLSDYIETILNGTAEEKRKLAMTYFQMAETPQELKDIGLTGDSFTVRYGVISRHKDKDVAHNLSADEWKAVCKKLENADNLVVAKRNEGFNIFLGLADTTLVGITVKNAGKNLIVNSVKTVFKRDIKESDVIVYPVGNKMSPEQSALLNRKPLSISASDDTDSSVSQSVKNASEKSKKDLELELAAIQKQGDDLFLKRLHADRRYKKLEKRETEIDNQQHNDKILERYRQAYFDECNQYGHVDHSYNYHRLMERHRIYDRKYGDVCRQREALETEIRQKLEEEGALDKLRQRYAKVQAELDALEQQRHETQKSLRPRLMLRKSVARWALRAPLPRLAFDKSGRVVVRR